MSHVVVIVFEKLTLLGAFSDYFLKEGGRGTAAPPLTAYAPPYHTRLAFLPDLLVCF